MEQFTGLVRRCVEDYDMIRDGDTIAVGLSGGKDSMALLCALNSLRRYYPHHFELVGVTVGLGFPDMDFSPVRAFVESMGVPYYFVQSDIADVVFRERQEKNPCSLCAKMRKGAFHDKLKELGANKAALGHHMDDAVETFLLSLIYEGRISCFEPVTHMDRSGITQIRPMLYAEEKRITGLARKYAFPIVESTCPMNTTSKRNLVKNYMYEISRERKDFKIKTFRAMQRLPLHGWETVRQEEDHAGAAGKKPGP